MEFYLIDGEEVRGTGLVAESEGRAAGNLRG